MRGGFWTRSGVKLDRFEHINYYIRPFDKIRHPIPNSSVSGLYESFDSLSALLHIFRNNVLHTTGFNIQ